MFKKIAKFSLSVLSQILEDSINEKEYEPTAQEISCGEKLPFTGEYFIPNKK